MNKTLINMLPSFAARYLVDNLGLQKILTNIGWLFFDKILRSGVSLFVGIWVAKYLGPKLFGLLNYVIAFVGLFAAFAKMGLDNIVVRDIVRFPDDAGEIIGTSFVLKLCGSVLLVVSSIILISFFRPNQPLILAMTALVAIGFVIQSFEVIDFLFRSQVKSKYVVLAQNAAFLLNSIFKVLLIILYASVIFFAFANLIEATLAAIGLIIINNVYGYPIKNWQFRFKRAYFLLKESWPLFFSGFFVVIFFQIDQIMIGQILGDDAVGLYSAAVIISSAFYFIPIAITQSVQPSIIQAEKTDRAIYYTRLQDLFTCMALLAYTIIIPVSILSKHLIEWLYGPAYAGAGVVLAIHVYALAFVSIGLARQIWVTNESHMKFALFSNFLAAVINVVLNLIWIKQYGIIGAAYATLLSYFVAYIGSSFLLKETRRIFFMQIKSLFLFDLFRLYQNFFSRYKS